MVARGDRAFPTNWGAKKEPQNPQNHRVVRNGCFQK